MRSQQVKTSEQRILARMLARELTKDELEQVAGGVVHSNQNGETGKSLPAPTNPDQWQDYEV